VRWKRKKLHMKLRYKVVIIQRFLAQYRKAFYELLTGRLAQTNVEIVLLHGFPSKSEADKKDEIEIEWAHQIKNKCIKIGLRDLYWQTCLKHIRDADLIIVEQASKLLLNYVLFMGQIFGIKKLCFWGHGKNFQENNISCIGERVKHFMSRHVHWWFAYNDLSAGIVRLLGYPEDRITSVQNSIDTHYLYKVHQNISQSQLRQVKQKLGIKGYNVCLYVGGMYPGKRLDFLINACLHIKDAEPDFEMIFIGGGPDEERVKVAAKKFEWVYYLGPKFNEEKVPYFLISKLFLMPYLVGLAILDTFALETPMITIDATCHGPEIDYVVDGVNGSIVKKTDDPSLYAAQVSYLLKNDEAREKLVAGCRASREKYTIEEMVKRFAGGVMNALAS